MPLRNSLVTPYRNRVLCVVDSHELTAKCFHRLLQNNKLLLIDYDCKEVYKPAHMLGELAGYEILLFGFVNILPSQTVVGTCATRTIDGIRLLEHCPLGYRPWTSKRRYS